MGPMDWKVSKNSKLTRYSYSLLFVALILWSYIPYIIPEESSLLVFNRTSFFIEILFILISTIAAFGTLFNSNKTYIFGLTSILTSILIIAYGQFFINPGTNPLQFLSIATLILTVGIYAKVFKPETSLYQALSS